MGSRAARPRCHVANPVRGDVDPAGEQQGDERGTDHAVIAPAASEVRRLGSQGMVLSFRGSAKLEAGGLTMPRILEEPETRVKWHEAESCRRDGVIAR